MDHRLAVKPKALASGGEAWLLRQETQRACSLYSSGRRATGMVCLEASASAGANLERAVGSSKSVNAAAAVGLRTPLGIALIRILIGRAYPRLRCVL
jgi:hypothetical protein